MTDPRLIVFIKIPLLGKNKCFIAPDTLLYVLLL